MIKGMTVDDLLQDAIYQPSPRTDTYFSSLAFLEEHIGRDAVESYAKQHPSRSHHAFADLSWWAMGETYPAFTLPTEALPRLWLAQAKYAVANDYMPSNFHEWAIAILEWFDVERYRKAHGISEAEYQAMSADLNVVTEALRSYPKDKLAKPWPD